MRSDGLVRVLLLWLVAIFHLGIFFRGLLLVTRVSQLERLDLAELFLKLELNLSLFLPQLAVVLDGLLVLLVDVLEPVLCLLLLFVALFLLALETLNLRHAVIQLL